MKRLFAVIESHGGAWDHSRIMDEQADWPAHAAFMDALTEEGFVALGGPLEGTGDAMLIVRASSDSEVTERLAADPWIRNGLLIVKQISPWRIRLGSLI